MWADDTCIGKEHIETPISGQGVVNDGAHAVLVRGIEGTRVNLNTGVPLVDLAPVGLKMLRIPVADVQRSRPILCVLVGGGATDSKRRVCACVICKQANQMYEVDMGS